MPDVLEKDRIPYQDQAMRLFNLDVDGVNSSGDQQVIPFLGAGVSFSARGPRTAQRELPDDPSQDVRERICQELGLHNEAKTFMHLAILMACRLEAAQKALPTINGGGVVNSIYPPSAGELTEYFCKLAKYTRFEQVVNRIRDEFPTSLPDTSNEDLIGMLKLLARETGIANPPDALTSITSYYENHNGRTSLWRNLGFIGKYQNPSHTHDLLAESAKHHLAHQQVMEDYLIITTNYDCLMEKALDKLDVPYAALVTKKSDQKVAVRFSNRIPNAARLNERNSNKDYPNFFMLSKPGNLVILYKIHGCLNPDLLESDDGVIISDDDYVNYVSQMGTNEGVIPAHVNSLLQNKPLLFLGYSLSDWNVRSIFETLRRKRNPDRKIRDFAIMYRIEEYEKIFFDNNNVQIMKVDLDSYVENIRKFI